MLFLLVLCIFGLFCLLFPCLSESSCVFCILTSSIFVFLPSREFLSRVIQTITLSPTCRSVWLLARCTSYQDIPFVLRVPILGRPNSPISLTLRQQLSLSFSLLHTLIFH
ncbi:hypothetical protein LINPERPRIM_LOCUS32993 [Linum perenne]